MVLGQRFDDVISDVSKGGDEMNWVKNLTDSIDYMEAHLTEELSIDRIAQVALASPFYYQRMFYMLTGMTVYEYIRKRRLTLAACEIISSDCKVLDTALKYGYETSESFSRAFKKLHGVSPSAAKKNKVTIKSFPRLQIQIVLKGEESMDYKIEKKESFGFYGISRTFSTVDGANFKEIPMFWQETMKDGSYEQMLKHRSEVSCLGVCMPMEVGIDTDFDYIIGAFSDKPVEGYAWHEVPSVDWAVFEVHGSIQTQLQDTWKRIFSEWFPATGFTHLPLPELEVYFEGDVNSDDYYMEVWIPIKKTS